MFSSRHGLGRLGPHFPTAWNSLWTSWGLSLAGQIRLWSSHAAQHPPIAHTNLTLASEQGCNFNRCRSLHLHQKQARSAECFLSHQSHRQESCWLYTIKSYVPCTPVAHTETHHSLNAVPGTNLPAGRELPAQLEIQPMGGFQTRLQLLCISSSCKASSCFSPSWSLCCWAKQLLLRAGCRNSIWAVECRLGIWAMPQHGEIITEAQENEWVLGKEGREERRGEEEEKARAEREEASRNIFNQQTMQKSQQTWAPSENQMGTMWATKQGKKVN